jgi:hypothetical protein
MPLYQWSTTPANNASAGAIDWAEGQPPSTVNDSARQMMADVAAQFQNGWDWLNFGDTPAYVSATQFTVPGNLTSRYVVGRRVRASVTAGTIYGTIGVSAFTSLTTVTVTWDSGSLDSGLSEVNVGSLNPAAISIPSSWTMYGPGQAGNLTFSISDTGNPNGVNIKFTGSGVNPTKYMRVQGGNLILLNSAGNTSLLTLDDSGNLTAAANITAYSDKRLKANIETIDNALARVKKLNGVTYNRKDIEQGVRHMGLIAQEVQRVAPETVRVGPDGLMSVAYGNLVGLLVEAVKELAAEVETLKGAK